MLENANIFFNYVKWFISYKNLDLEICVLTIDDMKLKTNFRKFIQSNFGSCHD